MLNEEIDHGRRIKNFADLIARGALEIGDGYRAKNEELGGVGLIFLRAGHVRDTHVDFAGADHFKTTDRSRFGSKLARVGDVMVTTKGNSTGRVAFVTRDMPEFVYSPHLSFWRSLSPSVLNQGYLRLWARSAEFSRQLMAMSRSTDMAPYLSLSDQKRLRITLPNIAEQIAVAELADALEERLTTLRETNATLEAIAQALFKSWFVDFDPVRAKMEGLAPEAMDDAIASLFPASTRASEGGALPEGWSFRGLDEIATFMNGLALQKYPPTGQSDLPVIKIAQLKKGNTDGADYANSNMKPEYVVENGDVLFSWSGSLEVALWCGGQGALNQHLFKVTSTRYPKWFYYFWTKAHLPSFRQIAASKATTMGHIQRAHLSAAKVPVPPDALIDAASRVLSPLLDRMVVTAIHAQDLAELRDTLLPHLISGKLRLPDAEGLLNAAP